MKSCIITGGTGTLGRELIRQITVGKYFDPIVVFSRDEAKHIELEREYDNVRTFLGDVVRSEDIGSCIRRYQPDTVFHCAALKHVDRGEAQTSQYINVNLNGTINVTNACSNFRVKNMVFFSTDKAVLPINAYGMTKALAEKYIQSKWSDDEKSTNFAIYRWGNILGSNGSVLKQFVKDIIDKKRIKITHQDMTRFWLTISEAVFYVLNSYLERTIQPRICPTIKAATLIDLAYAVASCLSMEYDLDFKITGIRPGEKIHEHLKSDHDFCIRSDNATKYKADELEAKIKPTVLELARCLK